MLKALHSYYLNVNGLKNGFCLYALEHTFRWNSDEPQEPEPVFFHSPCFDFFDDEVVTSGAVAICDFTPGAGYLLWSSVLRGVPSLGVCISELHKEMLHDHLLKMCLQAMTKEDSDLHDPRLVEVLGKHGESAAAAAVAAAAAKAAATAKGKAKAKARPSALKGEAKAKAKKAHFAEEPAEEDPDLDEVEEEEEAPAASQVQVGGSSASTASASGAGNVSPTASPAEARLLAKLAAIGR